MTRSYNLADVADRARRRRASLRIEHLESRLAPGDVLGWATLFPEPMPTFAAVNARSFEEPLTNRPETRVEMEVAGVARGRADQDFPADAAPAWVMPAAQPEEYELQEAVAAVGQLAPPSAPEVSAVAVPASGDRKAGSPVSAHPLLLEEDPEAGILGGVTFQVAFDDPQGQFAALYGAITSTMLAAGASWAAHLKGQASLEILVGFPNTIPRATGRSFTAAYVRTEAGINIYEQGAGHEVRTGTDPNAALPDIEINISPNYLMNELWFDPDPARQTAPVPNNRTDAISVFRHELGHALAFNGWRNGTTGQLPGPYQSTFDERVVFTAGNLFFTGTRAQRRYGGPLAVTYGNYGHLGNTPPRPGADLIPDMMNGIVYNRGTRYQVTPLDVAITGDVGLPVRPQLVARALIPL